MTDRPKRIQRLRTKGWRMPPGAVYVGRPSRWGNPYTATSSAVRALAQRRGGDDWWAVAATLRTLYSRWLSRGHLLPDPDPAVRDLLMRADADAGVFERPQLTHAEIRAALRGKDLACWCPLDQPCHADVLLTLANDGGAA